MTTARVGRIQICLFALLVASLAATASPAAGTGNPNIVIIPADDFG